MLPMGMSLPGSQGFAVPTTGPCERKIRLLGSLASHNRKIWLLNTAAPSEADVLSISLITVPAGQLFVAPVADCEKKIRLLGSLAFQNTNNCLLNTATATESDVLSL